MQQPTDLNPAVLEVRAIFKKVRQRLKIDRSRRRSTEAMVFEMLAVVEDASELLKEAWKVSALYGITNKDMQKEFKEIFEYFDKIRGDIQKQYKQKH